ncbi:hypothetical protein [Marinobacterium iners]|uniref:Uncharacterized protein n=1 Tax=Marinobacterium iners DSM 11526 TaxID=1122198 RepID=A0A1H3X3N2_9GAMM|nr:hypothetical protein [Marinobacterium iners]SDZ93863.1 hypothetical protein SAMN02745729_10127 [Marinobacterium iners DSM 11526]
MLAFKATDMPLLLRDEKEHELFAHLSDPDQNQEEYARLMQQESVELGASLGIDLPEGYELRMIEHRNEEKELEIFVLNHETKRVALFNRIEKTNYHLDGISDKPVKQAMIWRQNRKADSVATRDVVEAVFFRKLVHEYNIVVSDCEQTRNGKRMWERLLDIAIDTEGLMAAVGDAINGKVTRIHNEKELAAQEKWLWGQMDFHRERLAVIASV